MRRVINTAMKVFTVMTLTSVCLTVRAQDHETIFTNTASQVPRMVADIFKAGNILFSENDVLKTSNGTHTDTLEIDPRYSWRIPPFEGIGGFCQHSVWTYVVETDRHCLRQYDRRTGYTSPFIGQCDQAGNSNGAQTAEVNDEVKLSFPTDCLYDDTEELFLVADSGNRVIRAYSFATQMVTTYLKLEDDSAPIVGMTKNSITEDIYIYTQSPSSSKVYKIHRSVSQGTKFKVVEQVLSYTQPAELISHDLILVNGGLVTAVLEAGETRIRVLHHGESQTGCNITVNSVSNSVSLLTVGSDLFIGRNDSITRVADISAKLSCATFDDPKAPRNAQIFSENIGVSAYQNVMHIAADEAIPGNLMFSDFDGLHTFNPIANSTGQISKDTIYALERNVLNAFPVITGFVQMDSQSILITAAHLWNQIRLVERNGTAADLVKRSFNGGDFDGDIASSQLNKPLVIIGDNKQPGRYLFSDRDNGKIKSLNVSAKTVQTEYTGRNEMTALAQHPDSGEFYFADRATGQWAQNLQRISNSLNSASVELIANVSTSSQDFSGDILFNDLIFLDGGNKLMLLVPNTSTKIYELKLYDVSTSSISPIPRKITCNFDIAGVSFYQGAPPSVAGVFLSSDDTLYIGNTRGISKIPNFTNVLRTYCPFF